MKASSHRFLLALLVLPLIAGCAFPIAISQATQPPVVEQPADQNAINTAVAQTVIAVAVEQTAAAVGAPPTNTAEPPPPADTVAPPTETTEPTATLEPTPSTPMIKANIDTNCRYGPGPDYGVIGYLMVSDGKQPVRGRNSSNTWWYVANPDYPSASCWAWGDSTAVEGDIGSVPVVNAPVPGLEAGASPKNYSGACPVTITFLANISMGGPATITYRFEAAGGGSTANSTVTISNAGGGTVTVSTTKDYNVDTEDKIRIHVVSPVNIASGWSSYKVDCP